MSCNSSTHGAAVCEKASSAAAAAAVGTPVARRVAVTVWGVQNPLVSGERFSVNIAAKSLDGLPLDGLRIAVVDGNGRQVASTEPDLAQDRLACETAVDLEAPGQTGPQTWHAVPAIADARGGAGRPIPLSVTPRPTRPVRLQVTDAKSGKPLSDASAYFYHRNLAKVRPLCAVSDGEGFVDALIVEGAPYNVRIECRGYREGICNLDAGNAATRAEGVVALVPRNPGDEFFTFGRFGPMGY